MRLQDDAILVGLSVDGRDLPLAESVVERVGDALHGNAEPAGLFAVDVNAHARAAFLRFLHLAAREAGQIVNYASIASESGISQPTVKSYYQLLEDMFVGFQVPAWSRSPRKGVLSTPRFFLFDLGVRHAAAGLQASRTTVRANPGPLFEQWVGIELWKRLQYLGAGKLHYLRTKAGAEVDFIIARGGRLIPVEVKWTEHPTVNDVRHLLTFLDEHPKRARKGWLICRCSAPLALTDRVTALPWSCL